MTINEMTPELLAYLSEEQQAAWERCQKASMGPWVEGVDGNARVYGPDNTTGAGLVASFVRGVDRAFTTHARQDLPAALLELAQTKAALAELRAAVDAAPCPWDCDSMVLYCPSCGTAHPEDREEWCCMDNRYGKTAPAHTKPCDCWKSRLPK